VWVRDRQPDTTEAEDADVGPAQVVHRLVRDVLHESERLVEVAERQLAH
jgi:hypothetical protein